MTSQTPYAVRLLLAACLMAACGSPPTEHLWIAGDVHVREPGPLHTLDLDGIGVANLEGPIAAVVDGPGLRLGHGAGIASRLRAAGFGILGIANNHDGDAGPEGATATATALAADGLQPAGHGHVGRLKIGGVQIAITAHLAGRDPTPTRPPGAGFWVATVHLIAPPSYLPSPAARAQIEAVVAAGADVVAVHGSHVIGPLELRDQQVIAWGLGNFVFHCRCTQEDEAVVLLLRFRDGRFEGASLQPIQAGLGGPAGPSADPEGMMRLIEGLKSFAMNSRPQ